MICKTVVYFSGVLSDEEQTEEEEEDRENGNHIPPSEHFISITLICDYDLIGLR